MVNAFIIIMILLYIKCFEPSYVVIPSWIMLFLLYLIQQIEFFSYFKKTIQLNTGIAIIRKSLSMDIVNLIKYNMTSKVDFINNIVFIFLAILLQTKIIMRSNIDTNTITFLKIINQAPFSVIFICLYLWHLICLLSYVIRLNRLQKRLRSKLQ